MPRHTARHCDYTTKSLIGLKPIAKNGESHSINSQYYGKNFSLGSHLDLRQPRLYIVEDVHEVDVAVVGGVVGGEVFVDIAVGPVLGAHVVEVVARGELAPVGDDVLDVLELLGIAL